MNRTNHEYLGDGVYASFDGYQIWLHLNDHNSPPLIALEPSVMDALNRYATLEPSVMDALNRYVTKIEEIRKQNRRESDQTILTIFA